MQMVRTIRRESPGYGLLMVGQFVSLLGDRAASLALAWTVLDLTGSTLSMGTIQFFWLLPTVLLLPFTGWASDNLPRIGVMAITDLVRALVVGVAAILALRHALDLRALELLVVALGAGSAFFMPSSQALRAELLTPSSRAVGNALTSILQPMPSLVGPFVGAALLALGGAAVAFGLDAASFLISLASLLLLAGVMRGRAAAGSKPTRVREPFLHQVMGGLRFVLDSPWLWITIVIFSLINVFLMGASSVLLPWLIKQHLHLGASSLAAVTTATGLGAILGGLLMGRRKGLRYRAWWAYGAVAMQGVALLLMAFSPLPLIVLLGAVYGLGISVFGVIWETSLQELVPREFFGRVVSLDILGSIGLSPIGVLLVGAVAQWAGELATLAALGVLTVAFSGLALCFKGVRAYS